MAVLPRWFRRVSEHPLIVTILMLALIGGVVPAGAQSPVASFPPIKLIHLHEHTCPAGVDPRAGSLLDAATACPQTIPNVSFTLSSQDPAFAPQNHPTNSSSDTEWHEVPSGFPYTIQQVIPAGYGNPVVRCQMGQNVQTNANSVELTFEAQGGSLTIGGNDLSLTYFMDNSCYWFDVPAMPVGPGSEAAPQADTAQVATDEAPPTATATPISGPGSEAAPPAQVADATTDDVVADGTPGVIAAQTGGTRLDIRAWRCPFHAATKAATIDQLYAMCTQPDSDANFIINNDPATQQYTNSGGGTNYASVPFGVVSIRYLGSTNTYDPVRVFCYTQPFTASHGPLDASKERAFTVSNGGDVTVTLQVNPGDAIDCIWFDQLVTANNTGSVLVQTYTCPSGTNTSTGGLNELMAECQPPHAGVAFVLANQFLSASATTDSAGRLAILNYSPGPYSLQQIAPQTHVAARVFCRAYNADDWDHLVDPYVEFPVVNTNGIALQLREHWELDCIWFDLAGDNFAFLDITTYACPANLTLPNTNPRNTAAQRCTVPVERASFRVTTQTGFDKSADSVAGSAFFQEKVPPETLAIQETDPPVYQLFASFCGSAPYVGIGAIPTSWTANGDSTLVGFKAKVKDQVVCEFYYKPISIAGGTDPTATPGTSPERAASTVANDEGATASESGTGTGTLSVTLFACPGAAFSRSNCTVATGPAMLHFEPGSGDGAAFDLQIGSSVTGMADVTGSYVLTTFPVGTCLVESDGFDGSGQLTVPPGEVVEVRVYTCSG